MLDRRRRRRLGLRHLHPRARATLVVVRRPLFTRTCAHVRKHSEKVERETDADVPGVMGTTARPFCSHARMADSHLSWSHRSARSTESSCPSTFVPPSSCSGESCCASLARSDWTVGTCASSPSASTVTQPRRRDRARANSSRRRRPRQKFSTRVYISGGLRVGSVGSPSQRITSVSGFGLLLLLGAVGWAEEWARTDVAVDEPRVCRTAHGSADADQTMLVCAREQRSRWRICLEVLLPVSSTR